MNGRVGVAYTYQRDGSTNTAVSWTHSQEFSTRQSLHANLNYVTSTTLQRQNTFNPYTALATIALGARLPVEARPGVGHRRRDAQAVSRSPADRSRPCRRSTSRRRRSGSASSSAGRRVSATAAATCSKIDQPGIGAVRLQPEPVTGSATAPCRRTGARATRRSRSTRRSRFSAGRSRTRSTSTTRGRISRSSSRSTTSRRAPSPRRASSPRHTRRRSTGTPTSGCRSLWQNKFNLTPTIALQNVDPGPFWVASERTDGVYVHQAKRITAGLSAAPTLFGLFGGFGPFQRIRHSITPTIGWSYGPKTDVSDEYLAALGRTRDGIVHEPAAEQRSRSVSRSCFRRSCARRTTRIPREARRSTSSPSR